MLQIEDVKRYFYEFDDLYWAIKIASKVVSKS
jgi:hypothetical protein